MGLEKFVKSKIKVIGQGLEKYLTMNFGQHIVFKDSYQFLGASLANLAKNLLNSGGLQQFNTIQEEFSNNYSEHQLNLLLKKGIYPYEYMNDWEKFKEESLPSIENFKNTLRQEKCSEQDYSHASNVWKIFKCKTIQDYHDLYLETDVLLLADIFETFRKFGLEYYRLDPAHYVSSPQLSWDAMLLETGVCLDLMWDPQMFQMIDKGIRGGVAMISKRYAKANNPEMNNEYNPIEAISYIIYLDANNL